MKQFNDKNGRAWQIDLTIGTVMRVRSVRPEFDLLDPTIPADGQPLQLNLAMNLSMFWELLWLIMEPQARLRDISAEQFGEAMAADCLIEARIAFFAEWRDFFHSLRRPDAAMAVETQAKTMAATLRLVTAKMQTLDQVTLLKKIESRLEKEISGQFGKLQESLDLIQKD